MNDLWQETVERWARQVEAVRAAQSAIDALGSVTVTASDPGFQSSVVNGPAKPMFCMATRLDYYSECDGSQLRTALTDVEALGCKVAALMSDLHSLQAENKRLSDLLAASEEKVVTDTEQMADQMRQDILGGKIDKVGRKVVRDACDQMDAPPVGRDKQDGALGNISRRGGW